MTGRKLWVKVTSPTLRIHEASAGGYRPEDVTSHCFEGDPHWTPGRPDGTAPAPARGRAGTGMGKAMAGGLGLLGEGE